ncbi:MAG: alpha/beta hydrolase [Candidatus Paceibacterota bacterium]|jgi:hypothetical protein
MKKIFLIHGFEGEPNGGWRPWLMGELAKYGVYACALPMPSPEKPICKDWLAMIDYCIGKPNKDTYLVGHSLGVPAILRYLEKTKVKIGGAVLVSGPIKTKKGYRNGKLDTFFAQPFDLKLIKRKASKFTVIHGDNDQLVDITQDEELAKLLSCELIKVKNGGHLNGSSGFRELPQALVALKKIASLKPFKGTIY